MTREVDEGKKNGGCLDAYHGDPPEGKSGSEEEKGENGVDTSDENFREGHDRALSLLRDCDGPHGFLASPSHRANYRRVWGRDGAILSLAALMTEDEELVDAARRTLQTLAEHQGPHGEIPSNVDPESDRISYGGMAGRVDADLWFLIACGQYWKVTEDDRFLERMAKPMDKVRFLLGAWEFNNRGLLYIPETGDWADEYLQNGYVLYDQLLYFQALRTLCAIRSHLHGSRDHRLEDRTNRLKHVIRANYWFKDSDSVPDDVYHEILFKKGRKAATHCNRNYWMPFFSPHGYGYRFDAFANVLVSLLDVSDPERRESVDRYIDNHLVDSDCPLLPAFYPVITPVDKDWEELHMTFSYSFKNRPHEYHNGGRWPMLTGFYVADLARRGKAEAARRFLGGIHRGNALEMEGEPWSFPEYVHGRDYVAGGTRHQGWSAAGALIGHYSLENKEVFRINEN
ncbi:MAG: amylo-alpha-1,6-glucosidase [Thermodesulfobacteriota bacterium]